MKALRYLLYSLVIAAVLGLLYYESRIAHTLTTASLVRAGLIIAAALLGMLRTPRRGRLTKAQCQAAYGHLIGSAFSGEPKLEKLLYSALNDFYAGRHSAALKKLEHLRAESPRSADRFTVLSFMALCHSRQGNFTDAVRLYTAALQIREHSTVASNLGNCYLELGRTDEALDAFLRAIRADSRNPNAHNNIAQLYIRLGEYEDALSYAQTAVEIDDKMPAALNAMAICYAMLDYDEEAGIYFRRAVANGSDAKALRAYIQNLKG